MPRQARLVADGVPHHITQRGNNRQEVFLLDEDRRFYLDTFASKLVATACGCWVIAC
jgi:putative transposase